MKRIFKYILNKVVVLFVLLLLFSYGVFTSWYILELCDSFYWGDLLKLVICLVMLLSVFYYYLMEGEAL